MRITRLTPLGALLIASSLLAGCAPAYHAYPDGCVTYGYPEQPPPPFRFFQGCPTPWLSRYATRTGAGAESMTAPATRSSRRRPQPVADYVERASSLARELKRSQVRAKKRQRGRLRYEGQTR